MRDPRLTATLRRVVPDLNGLAARLEGGQAGDLRQAGDLGQLGDLLGTGRSGGTALVGGPAALVGAPAEDLPAAFAGGDDLALERTMAGARDAVSKIREHGDDADLTPAERSGLEAIVVIWGRPAILVQGGDFFPPPDPWQHLAEHRDAIRTVLRSVGRIEVDGHPRRSWVGTGFVVAPGIVMTNRHVAKEFARPVAGGDWTFEPGMSVRIDFAEEIGGAALEHRRRAEFPVTEILALHDEHDLALLRLGEQPDRPAPAPLPLSAGGRGVRKGREVYVVGYPAADPGRNDPAEMTRIFSGIYDVKRLQPGELRAVRSRRHALEHDCSTLGGNSGSCVVDLASHEVVGLHVRGTYLVTNVAVALWTLAGDPVLRAAGIG